MATPEAFVPSTIKVLLKGLIVLFTNRTSECKIGLLTRAPNHNYRIEIITDPGGASVLALNGRDAVAGNFELNVTDNTETGIRRRFPNEQIDRFLGPLNASREQLETAKWLIDFEKDFYPPPPPPIGARKSEFISLITLNNGEIFTRQISDNHLQFRRANNSNLWFHVGKVAVRIGIEITLNRPESRAVFKKNGGELITLGPGQNYQMHIERTDTTTTHIGRDADYYFSAVGSNLLPEQFLTFRSFPRPEGTPTPSTPDATCPVTELSQSDPT